MATYYLLFEKLCFYVIVDLLLNGTCLESYESYTYTWLHT